MTRLSAALGLAIGRDPIRLPRLSAVTRKSLFISVRRRRDVELAVREARAPLVGLGTVKTQAETFDMTCRTVDFKHAEICAAIPDASDDMSPVVRDPCGRPRQRMEPSQHVNVPCAELKVEVVPAVSNRFGGRA